MSSHTRNSWQQIFSLWHHIHSLGHHTTLCMKSSPLYLSSRPLHLSSRPLHLCHHTQPIDDITATTRKVLHAVYLWYHIPYVFDNISTKYDITTLCVDVTNSAYIWHPLHCRWHRIHSITPNHIIYYVTSTSGMTSHPLYQILHPLYLCHHNLSTDITPTFEWQNTHLLCDILCPI